MEGAQEPFIVLTDHQNLEYLQEAKRLNPHQARWDLFFTRFHFSISYRPGSRNLKADALSRLHAPEEDNQEPEPILSEDMFLSPIQWAPESILTPSVSTSEPPGCPPGLQYVPQRQRTPIIHSAHSSLGTGHPWNHLAAKRSLLVAQHGPRREKVRTRMLRLCRLQESPPPSIWQTPSAARSNSTMVTFRSGLHNRSPTIKRQHLHISHCG